jgi:lysyl-tRNA synthetase class 2
LLKIERHELGPRLYVLGRRLHECHAGIALLLAFALLRLLGVRLDGELEAPLLAVGAWFLWKDWHDLFPGRRDCTAWRLGVHREPHPLRERRRATWLPPLAGVAASLMGVVNIGSALTPDLSSRAHVLLRLVPREVPVAAHALALSAGLALVILGLYLARRRRRAWALAVTVLVVAGALNVLKGLDVEEALASWLLAALLVWGRDGFHVLHDGNGLRAALTRSVAAVTATIGAAALAVAAASHWGTPGLTGARLFGELSDSLALAAGPIHFREPFGWLPVGLDVLWGSAALAVAWLLFRPLASHGLGGDTRALARDVVRRHGHDTLSFFKLRDDKLHFFDSTRRAFVGYRIESGVLLISGDPVGPEDALPGLLRELCAFAEVRALRIGVVGASQRFAELAAGAGLRSFYIGDEAIVELSAFSLEGRAIRKVRQSVTRSRKAGLTASVHRLGDLSEAQLSALEAVSKRWRGDEPERGFSMAVDSLRGEHLAESVVVVARDGEDRPRGFLHFVPCYGRPAMSLGLMRRERDSVNGLMEFLIVSSIELLRERGVEELSLNFAAFARLLHSPTGAFERLLARLVALGNPFFQIESLYRFNAKFSPRWQPRYLLYERRPLGFARTGLAAMWAEGQLPKPRLRSAA